MAPDVFVKLTHFILILKIKVVEVKVVFWICWIGHVNYSLLVGKKLRSVNNKLVWNGIWLWFFVKKLFLDRNSVGDGGRHHPFLFIKKIAVDRGFGVPREDSTLNFDFALVSLHVTTWLVILTKTEFVLFFLHLLILVLHHMFYLRIIFIGHIHARGNDIDWFKFVNKSLSNRFLFYLCFRQECLIVCLK